MTQLFQHQFARIEDYLHHRHPHLMVSAIDSIGDCDIESSTDVTGEEYFMTGHFSGSAIVSAFFM